MVEHAQCFRQSCIAPLLHFDDHAHLALLSSASSSVALLCAVSAAVLARWVSISASSSACRNLQEHVLADSWVPATGQQMLVDAAHIDQDKSWGRGPSRAAAEPRGMHLPITSHKAILSSPFNLARRNADS